MSGLPATCRGWPDRVQSCTGKQRDTVVAFPSQTWSHVSYYAPDVRGVDGQSFLFLPLAFLALCWQVSAPDTPAIPPPHTHTLPVMFTLLLFC